MQHGAGRVSLPAAPRAVVDADGIPALGRFEGKAADIDWAALAPPLQRSAWWRRFHHKRWHYVAMACEDVFCAVAIVDLGWTSTAFAYVFDRRERRLAASFSQDGLPGMGATLASHVDGASRFRFLSNRITIAPCGADQYSLTLRCAGMALDAEFGGSAPMLLATGTVAGGAVHATQKSGGLALAGEARCGARRYRLDGGVASIDYSNGLLARETAWHWACAHDMQMGFNLQAGYFGANENALWLNGKLIALGAASFHADAGNPMAPWHIATDDGLLELQFEPEGVRQESKNLLLAASEYVQPIGTFRGMVRASTTSPPVAVASLIGVTEQHSSRW